MVETRVAAADELGISGRKMKRAITGFDRDDDGNWRAKLACGHYQHVRHDPPLRVREWVLSEEGRSSRVGHELECRTCGEGAPADF